MPDVPEMIIDDYRRWESVGDIIRYYFGKRTSRGRSRKQSAIGRGPSCRYYSHIFISTMRIINDFITNYLFNRAPTMPIYKHHRENLRYMCTRAGLNFTQLKFERTSCRPDGPTNIIIIIIIPEPRFRIGQTWRTDGVTRTRNGKGWHGHYV